MKMKIFKIGLRLWITIASMFSFFVGWIMLSHSPKPTQPSSSTQSIVTPLPTLEPLPPLSGNDNASVQNQQFFFNNQPQPSFRSRPFFSTGGS
jgi:hypothetical protein